MSLEYVMQLHYSANMNPNEEESSLTDRYQTTVPARIRKALGLSKKDKLKWFIDESGGIVVQKVGSDQEHSDPILDAWLTFIEKDIAEHPERLVTLGDQWYEEMVFEVSGERGVGLPGLPPTLEEFQAQSKELKEDD